ncbi:MAG: hypothetical protein NC923_02235 [Candidatus Omnitrophica bacterium]|nr:hypothetical protein [Candidatus Omnitrophota bacterium]
MKSDAYSRKIKDIIKNAAKYHEAFYNNYKTGIFAGPALYFHRKSIEKLGAKDFEKYIEYIYATLVAWGMHRMGEKGAKMQDFETFLKSILPLMDDIKKARMMRLERKDSIDYKVIENIFKNINVMKSKTRLVGNSKVMAHLLPDLIPPVDRNYTLKYLKESISINNKIDKEWNLLKDLLDNFFNPIATNSQFLKKARKWLKNQARYIWDTSIPKIIDNLIIGRSLLKLKSRNF